MRGVHGDVRQEEDLVVGERGPVREMDRLVRVAEGEPRVTGPAAPAAVGEGGGGGGRFVSWIESGAGLVYRGAASSPPADDPDDPVVVLEEPDDDDEDPPPANPHAAAVSVALAAEEGVCVCLGDDGSEGVGVAARGLRGMGRRRARRPQRSRQGGPPGAPGARGGESRRGPAARCMIYV